MKTNFLILMAFCCLTFPVLAQSDARDYTNFPIVVSIQFHCLSLPFRDLKSNFSNIGIGLGTEVSYNGKQNFVQQLSMVWYHNKAVGNGLFFYSQAAWRPTIASDFYSEVKAGAGYLISFRPAESYKQVNGNWVSAGHHPKGMFTLPVGISVGNNVYTSGANYSPFVSYQLLITTGYNKSVPIVPETLLQIGTRIHIK